MAHWLFLPNDAIEDLETFSSLSSQALDGLVKIFDSGEFRPRYSFYVKLAEALQISDEAAARLCTFINHVQKQRTRSKKSGTSVPAELEHFIRNVPVKDADKARRDRLLKFVQMQRTVLERLFSDLPEHEFSEKVRELETGPLPHLKKFRTYCDIRPVYNTEGTEIVSCFPVITLFLAVHSEESDEMREVVVQLVESDIAEFKNQFDRLDKKLASMKTKYPVLFAARERG